MTTATVVWPQMDSKREVRPLDVSGFPLAARTNLLVPISEDATTQLVMLPIIVARGAQPGPVLGISAAVHGNELNGIRIIHRLVGGLDLMRLKGALVCAPIVNVPSFNVGKRHFPDGQDLNHVFPGRRQGRASEQYARRFVKTFLPACNYLIDIHTASEGRVNTMYVRVDWMLESARQLALWALPEIILHSRSGDGTLRQTAGSRGIPAITIEAGNPSAFQGRRIIEGDRGIRNIMNGLGMFDDGVEAMLPSPIICKSSRWLRTSNGGLLQTAFSLSETLSKGQRIAETLDPFGRVVSTYKAPYDGVVIGMSQNPVAVPGKRFCHLGEFGEPPAQVAKDY